MRASGLSRLGFSSRDRVGNVACVFYGTKCSVSPKQFLQLVRDAKAAKEPLQFIDRTEVDFDPRPGTLVLLGALICPGLCHTITCDGLFISRKGSAGREPHTTASNALQ